MEILQESDKVRSGTVDINKFIGDSINQYKNEDVLQQNCRVKRTYQKCNPLELCSPSAEFDMIEKCTICNKTI